MMYDPSNQHIIAAYFVKDSMLPMNQATDVIAKIRPQRSGKGKVTQPHERRVETVHVDFGYVVTESGDAEFVDLNQVRFGSIREFDFSHPLPGVWQ